MVFLSLKFHHLLSPSDSQSNENHLYMDILSSQQTYLTGSNKVNGYTKLSVKKSEALFEILAQNLSFLAILFTIFITWEHPEGCKPPVYENNVTKTNLSNFINDCRCFSFEILESKYCS